VLERSSLSLQQNQKGFNMKNFEMNFLSKDDIRRLAPVALAEGPTRQVSDKYVFASTHTVIDDLAGLGWKPTQASQRTSRNPESPSRFSPHMIKFANPDVVVKGKSDANITFPQIILINRHDGLGAFKFMAGMFRLVCSNGLVIATSTFASVAIPHKGYTFDELRKVVGDRTAALPETVEFMNQMKRRKLDVGQRRKLALDGLLLRAGIAPTSTEAEEYEKEYINGELIQSILAPARKEDAGTDLWSTFNVVQEKIVKGFEGGGRKVKSLKSFEKDLDLNTKLFESALAMMPAAEVEVVG